MDMKLNNILSKVLIYGILITPCILMAESAFSGVDDSTRIDLICETPGLNVWLDGELVGQTPLSSLKTNEGFHSIEVRHPDPGQWLGVNWEKSFFIRQNETITLEVTFPKSTWIMSQPSQATVYVNGRLKGATPLVLELPSDSAASITVEKEGYEIYHIDPMQINQTILQIQLIKSEGLIQLGNDVPRINRRWTWAGGILALVSGGIGFYCKYRADRAYDKYLQSNNPTDMNRHFDEAVRYDKLMGVFYGVGEASLGLSLIMVISGHWQL